MPNSKAVKYIDPPSGHLYGFPKILPDDVTDTISWLVEQGYPKSRIAEMGENFVCRHWIEWEKDDVE